MNDNEKQLTLCSLLRLRLAICDSMSAALSSSEPCAVSDFVILQNMDNTVSQVYDFVKLNF